MAPTHTHPPPTHTHSNLYIHRCKSKYNVTFNKQKQQLKKMWKTPDNNKKISKKNVIFFLSHRMEFFFSNRKLNDIRKIQKYNKKKKIYTNKKEKNHK